ncbi:MAG: hypothetical protein P8177_04995 [Gemmatimonadota bacterium]|jgi:hypothetical protein
MVAPVHVGTAGRFLRVVLNPRILMVYALLGGGAVRAWRRRRWLKRFEQRRRDRAGRGPGVGGGE